MLHDIGKIKIPSTILQKPSPLTVEEMEMVRKHTDLGYEMLLEAGETDELLLSATRDHHERLDGSGSPRKLSAPDISTAVRIVTLCDVFAAMTEPRPYTHSMEWDEALAQMAMKRTRLGLDLLGGFATMMRAIHVPQERSSSIRGRFRREKS